MGNYFTCKYIEPIEKYKTMSDLFWDDAIFPFHQIQHNFSKSLFFLMACFLILQYNFCTKKMKKKKTPNKKKSKSRTVSFFLASAVIVSAAVYYTIKEGRRIKEENKLLAYEVW